MLDEAIRFRPNVANLHYNKGVVLGYLGRLEDSIVAYRNAVRLQPRHVLGYYNLANALRDLGQLDEAISAYQSAIQIEPNFAEAHGNLANVLKDRGELHESLGEFRCALELKPELVTTHSAMIYSVHFHPEFSAQSILKEHQLWNERHAEPLKQFITSHKNDPSPDRRLRIGYVSPDLRDHPVGRFMLPLLAAHDRANFEIVVYSGLLRPDAITAQCQSHIDQWRQVERLSDEMLASQIRQDGIDILVDLSLHMAGNRLLVFARKPAPVQATYLGYVSTTGLTSIDYRLTDPYLDPIGVGDGIYAERSIRLPETYWCYEPTNFEPVSALPVLRTGLITFGCLNNFSKVSKPALVLWCRLLAQIPGSRLILHAPEGIGRQRVIEFASRFGVDARRIEFVGHVPLDRYYRLYNDIDIALDPYPYGGGTTSCDALWMGVPLVTFKGRTAVGRGGVSLLSNIGFTEWIASTEEQYFQIALSLASDVKKLAEIRASIRPRMQASPLMDKQRFARHMESAFRIMWKQWCSSER